MITGSLSLAFCTVVFRRFLDSVTGRIPPLPISNSPNTTTLFMFSGALYYLYNHLRKGTLVRIGHGHPKSATSSSRHLIQRHTKNKSWFLRNAWGRRKNYTDAICRIAKQSLESLQNLNPCVMLPNKSFQISFPKSSERSVSSRDSRCGTRNSCDLIYNNDVFEKESVEEVKTHVLRKRDGKRNVLKRLCREKVVEIVPVRQSNKFRKEAKRTTRSGRVYNPFS